MAESEVFGGIHANERDNVIRIFEETIIDIGKNTNSSLLEMNKLALINVNNILDRKREHNYALETNYPKVASLRSENIDMIQKEDEFNDTMVVKKPNPVDFSDKKTVK